MRFFDRTWVFGPLPILLLPCTWWLMSCSVLAGYDDYQFDLPGSAEDASLVPQDASSGAEDASSGAEDASIRDDGAPIHDSAGPEASPSEASTTDALSCPPHGKVCAGQCVSISDPAYGCSESGCEPCAEYGHSDVLCVGSSCTTHYPCVGPYQSCDSNDENGCETNTSTTVNHCGGCQKACSFEHTTQRDCTNGRCAPTCETGWGNCSEPTTGPDDGCETPLNTSANCQSCGTPCAIPHAVASCESMSCQFVECEPGWGNCNSDLSDGCETDLLTSPDHCGSCTRPCSISHVEGEPTCNGGLCDTDMCIPPWVNNTMPPAPHVDNGCEFRDFGGGEDPTKGP